MIAVYYFGHQECYILIAEKFNVTESTVKRTVDAISDALVNYAKQVKNKCPKFITEVYICLTYKFLVINALYLFLVFYSVDSYQKHNIEEW